MADVDPDPDTLNPAGWPRPRLPYKDGTMLPAPWVARVTYTGTIDPGRFDCARLRQTEVLWRCQVCGGPCSDSEAWAPVASSDYALVGPLPDGTTGAAWEVSGGPTCSERCCRLALAMCPHFGPDAQIIRYARVDTSWIDSESCEMGVLLIARWQTTPTTTTTPEN